PDRRQAQTGGGQTSVAPSRFRSTKSAVEDRCSLSTAEGLDHTPGNRRAFRRQRAKRLVRYFVGFGSSESRIHGQKFSGFAVSLPDLMTLIFAIAVSLRNTGRLMRQRYECRFERRLVTCRRIHVPKLGVRC